MLFLGTPIQVLVLMWQGLYQLSHIFHPVKSYGESLDYEESSCWGSFLDTDSMLSFSSNWVLSVPLPTFLSPDFPIC